MARAGARGTAKTFDDGSFGNEAADAKGNRGTRFLPDAASRYLKRRGQEIVGLCLLAAATVLAVALVGFDANDPSLNSVATGAEVIQNPLGRAGAVTADLILQSLGFASAILVLIPAVWGWRIMRHERPRHIAIRIAVTPIALSLTSFALSIAPVPAGWPLRSGLGGFLGSLLLNPAAGLAPMLEPVGGILALTIASGLAAFLVIAWLLGLRPRDGLAALVAGAGGGMWLGRMLFRGSAAGGRMGARAGAALGRSVGGMTRRQEPRLGGPDDPEDDDTEYGAYQDDDADEALDARPVARRIAPPAPAPTRPKAPLEAAPVAKRARKDTRQTSLDLGRPSGESGDYEFPPLDLLTDAPEITQGPDEDALDQNARMLESVLQDFGVKGTIGKVRYGPVVTLYELEPAPGTKSARVIGLSDDIARSMSAVSVRVAVVPGRNVIGIELPNAHREIVYFRDILESQTFRDSQHKLAIALGKDIGGSAVTVDLARMPHLLIAGTTGSGKSVAVNTMILSLLYRLPPERCRFIMIDPKMLELSVYDGIPHLLSPVVTDPKKAVVALKWTVREMESRYRAMSKLGVRNIDGYNARLAEAVKKGEVLKRKVQTGFDVETGKPVFEEEPLDLTPLPFIVVVIDEVADLMLVAGKDIEGAVQRLAQMARAAGIHVIMATQRPSVDVITGTIKANFPTRISFQVTSKIDSRTILGEQGAEQLLGQGDMLHMAGGGRITRVHGPFCSDEEVEDVVRHLKSQGEPEYDETITEDDEGLPDPLGMGGESPAGSSGDETYDQAVAIVAREGKASTSFIQRHLKIGYNRAASIIERMEQEGVVSQANHVGKREVLVGDHSASSMD
jgi:S-DNA-T family DNA segregation ATPase FtsK/SpoIIIE